MDENKLGTESGGRKTAWVAAGGVAVLGRCGKIWGNLYSLAWSGQGAPVRGSAPWQSLGGVALPRSTGKAQQILV